MKKTIYLSNIGGRCMGHYSLSKHIKEHNENMEYIFCPTGNMAYTNGFSNLHQLFDGTFYNTLLSDKITVYEEIHRVGDGGTTYVIPNMRVVHGNIHDEKFIQKLKNVWNNFFEKYNNEEIRENTLFFYTLNEYDVNKTTAEIEMEIEALKKYINIDNLFILGSKPINDPEYKNFKYNYRNDNFLKYFGNRYIIVEPSNNHKEACKCIYNKLITYLKK